MIEEEPDKESRVSRLKKPTAVKFSASPFLHGTGTQFAVRTHPGDVGERHSGEDPFVVAQVRDFDFLDDLHGADLYEPRRAGVETILDENIHSRRAEERMDCRVWKSPTANRQRKRAAKHFVIGT